MFQWNYHDIELKWMIITLTSIITRDSGYSQDLLAFFRPC